MIEQSQKKLTAVYLSNLNYKEQTQKGGIMLLIIALVIASLFVYFLKDKLKQYPNIFYIAEAEAAST